MHLLNMLYIRLQYIKHTDYAALESYCWSIVVSIPKRVVLDNDGEGALKGDEVFKCLPGEIRSKHDGGLNVEVASLSAYECTNLWQSSSHVIWSKKVRDDLWGLFAECDRVAISVG